MKEFESFGLDTGNECLWRNGAQLSLPPKPFAVLRYLVENPGRLITHDELLDALWPETYVQPQVLRTYMLELRKVLGDDAGNPRFIQTLPKRGYCFVAAVTDGTDALKRTVANGIRAQAETRSGNGVAATASHEPENGMVGREDEIARLRTGLKDAAKGQRQVFFVSGEVGIGKSALVDAFARIAGTFQAGDGVLVARGQCVEGFGGKEEYYPVVEVLSQLCGLPDGERACRILSTIAPTWMASHRKDSAAGAVVLERMPGDICAALEALAAEKPLILIFEDLHWADDATLHLISALARRRGEAQLMLVLTCRPQDGTALKGLRQDLRMKRLCAEVALSPLRKADVKELLRREMKQEDLPQGLASFVHQHSEGNPLFAIALLEHLIAQGFLVKARGEDRVWEQRAPFQEMEAGVPDGLAQMIELEIERLSPEEQCLLEAGSLMQVAFPAWAVAAALKKDTAETEDACDQLARRLYFLERAGQDELPDGTRSNFYAFAHGLYREVLYQRQAASRRTQRHIRIAERLQELFRGREAVVARDIAMHCEAAGDWRRAVEALRGAAHHARQRQAHGEADELLERAERIAVNLGGEPDLASSEGFHEVLTQP